MSILSYAIIVFNNSLNLTAKSAFAFVTHQVDLNAPKDVILVMAMVFFIIQIARHVTQMQR